MSWALVAGVVVGAILALVWFVLGFFVGLATSKNLWETREKEQK